MKILIISPFFPYPPDSGGAIRIYNLVKHLSSLHEITLLSYINPDQLQFQKDLSPYCRMVSLPLPEKSRSPLFHARYLFSELPYSLVYKDDQFKEKLIEISQDTWDIIQFEFLPFAHYVDCLPKFAKKVVVEHYIALESRKRLMKFWKPSYKKFYYFLELGKIRTYEQAIFDKFDLCLVTSKDHEQKLRAWKTSSRIRVSHNGVDTDHFTPLNGKAFHKSIDTHPKLVYMGAFHLEPANIDGLIYLLEDILPLIEKEVPGIGLEIIGKGLPCDFNKKYGNKKITIHGYMEDIRPVLGRAHAFLIPLRGGSGTKIRILTAMAMGIPVVATSMAANGFDLEQNKHILIGDTPQRFAEQTIKILKDFKLNHTIGDAGRQLVENKYSWKKVAEDLDRIYHTM